MDELIRRFSIWIGQDAMLRNNQGHMDWLTAARKQDWRLLDALSRMDRTISFARSR